MVYKFLFINAIESSRKNEIAFPPLGIGYLVSMLRKEFGESSIKFKVINNAVEKEIAKFKPHIVGITSVTQNYNKAVEYARITKKFELPVICGGVHISMLPHTLTEDMDVGVIGEGEKTICELFKLFENSGGFESEKLKKIYGIVYRDKDSKIYLTERRKLIKPVDKIPFPARDLFDISSEAYMFTSRGCPYRCVFCSSSRFWSTVRYFSAEYVVNEIKYLVKEYSIKNIMFYDDLFVANKRRIEKIIKILGEEDLLGRITFACQARANLVNNETVGLLKKMNITYISMGLESGSHRVLEYLKGSNITVKDNVTAVDIIKKYGIDVYGSFIIGSPYETEIEILQTLNFIKKSKLDGFDIYILIPFPGTPVWDYAESMGLVSEKMDFNRLSVNFSDSYEQAINLSENLSKEEIYRLFCLFQREQKKKRIYHLVLKGLQKPWKIPKFLVKYKDE